MEDVKGELITLLKYHGKYVKYGQGKLFTEFRNYLENLENLPEDQSALFALLDVLCDFFQQQGFDFSTEIVHEGKIGEPPLSEISGSVSEYRVKGLQKEQAEEAAGIVRLVGKMVYDGRKLYMFGLDILETEEPAGTFTLRFLI